MRSLLKPYISLTILLIVTNCSWAQEENANDNTKEQQSLDPYEWLTETYSFPNYELINGFTSKDRGSLKNPALPKANASKGAVFKYVKTSNSITSHFLDLQGLSLPKGTVVIFDPKSQTLTARAPRLIQNSIGFLADQYQSSADKYIVIDTCIIEAPSKTVRSILIKAEKANDLSMLKTELEKADGSRTVFYGQTETLSGNRSTLNSTRKIVYPNDYELLDNNSITFHSDLQEWGTVIEFECTIGNDNLTVDLNYTIERDYEEPKFTQQPITRQNGSTISIATLDRSFASTQTQKTVRSGSTILLGAWPASIGSEQPLNERKKMLISFAKVQVVKNLPVKNERLTDILATHADNIIKVPEGKPQFKKIAEEIPNGMIVRRFIIPPNFLLRNRGTTSTTDPFSSDLPNEPTFTVKATVKDILQNAGISFPKGSSANYLRGSSTLVIRNTPEEIELVEAFLTGFVHGSAKQISLTAFLVEAPGTLLRDLSERTRSLSNHDKQWKQLNLNKDVIILESIALTSLSGKRASTQWGYLYSYPESVNFFQNQSSDSKKEEQKYQITKDQLSAGIETSFIGTVFTAEPVLAADNYFIDLFFKLEHFNAKPVTTLPQEPTDQDKRIQMTGPITNFNQSNISNHCTLRDGSIRMISLWNPNKHDKGDKNNRMQALFIRANVLNSTEGIQTDNSFDNQ